MSFKCCKLKCRYLWCCIFVINVISRHHVSATTGVYFSIPSADVLLPANVLSLTGSVPLLRAQALLEQQLSTSQTTHITYNLASDPTPPKWVRVNQTSGIIYLLPALRAGKARRAVSVIVEAHAGDEIIEMRVTLQPSDVPLDCSKLSREVCFWKYLKFQFLENQRGADLGSPAPLYIPVVCPSLTLNYTVTHDNGSSISVSHGDDGWIIHSKGGQDREIGGSKRGAHLSCTSPLMSGSVEAPLSLEVLDQDDNTPVPQHHEITIWLESSHVKQGLSPDTSKLVFRDRDSANHYEVQVSDPLHILKASCNKWSLEPISPDTVIHCGVTFDRDAILPDTPYYRATVTLLDDSPPIKEGTKSKAEMTLVFKIEGKEHIGHETADFTHNGITFPLFEIHLSRHSTKYHRIVEPIKRVESEAHVEFQVVDTFRSFNVTPKTGIVYVSDTQTLREAQWKQNYITVEWKVSGSHQNVSKATFLVTLIDDLVECLNVSNNQFCAKYKTESDCVRSCGISSSDLCQWRNQTLNSTSIIPSYNSKYATCSPSFDTCPDGVCDELEMKKSYICPQDCTKHLEGSGMLSGTKRGIKLASGICWCSKYDTCTCSKGNKMAVDRTTQSTRFHTEPTPVKTAECGDGCLLSVVLGSLLFFSGVILLTIWIRRRKMFVGVRGKRKFTARAATARVVRLEGVDGPGGEGEGGILTEPEGLENKRPANHAANLMPDPKWEFPRERLRIEQVLGEGEFGRVLRASARDLPGLQGRSAVAVKTLKEGAGNAELTDLLSEYELLKEVSHPNVIRLLGACTSAGGPVYIIIEFAQHGSLRSYLRRSRRIEGPLPVNSTPLEEGEEAPPPPNPIEPVTPRDLLSFAWQISKGMGYLSDIKLVHRDLAARNVLVASGGVCKVSDFGLTRDVYEDDAYLKRSKGRVPVKWMALESLADNIYTSKCDVWSFGVLLWELVTLGSSPYPGIAVQNLFHLLRAGYRMERPENCSHPLYRLMQVCWEADPLDRPSFKDITVLLDGMLQDGADYLDLSPRAVHNRGYIGGNLTHRDSSADTVTTEADDSTTTGYGTLNTSNTSTFLLEPYTSMTPPDTAQDTTNTSKYESPINTSSSITVLPLTYIEIATSPDYNSA